MIRVTSNMMSNQLMMNINRNAKQLNDTQLQMSTGMKINKPSDDPVGITYALRYRTELNSNAEYQSNVDSAISWLDYSDTVVSQTNEVLQRMRELTVTASSGTNPQSALDSIRLEVNQLKEQFIDIGNSQLNGKYVFNGESYNQKPYDFAKNAENVSDTAGFTKDMIDTGNVNYAVGSGIQLAINVSGNDVMGSADDTDNVFAIADRLSEALKDGDLDAISAELAQMDTRVEKLTAAQAGIGAKMNRIELMQNRLGDMEYNLTSLQAKTEDADYAELAVRSQIQENIYNATLSVGAKIISSSLVDFLR
ncbi:flagellar hook-associated protein FlgL [Paenibacillus gallinarum]|uniref:Flagellar hook-associated protein FlgL n=1 Tax=Paenibacillus gallinarum TaxID=2762232 RepID=A0ABR8SZM6_9BACL|nr:flagellar hook-associated protein FlgL [Paenibacillus gallinarum]MBD7968946.1 flagellar hook-associated protein FlgL [Paenibacillus gallinarum]